MIRDDFLSDENLNVLYRVIKSHIYDKSGEDISNYPTLNISNRVRGVMMKIYETTDYSSLTGSREEGLIQLNKKVVRACVPGFLQMIEKAKSKPNVRMNRLDSRPVDTKMEDFSNNDNNVTSNFEKLNQERNVGQKIVKPKSINFTEEHDNSSLQNPTVLFEELEKKRDDEAIKLLAEKQENADNIDNIDNINNQGNTDYPDNQDNNNIITNIHPATINAVITDDPISAEPFSDKPFLNND